MVGVFGNLCCRDTGVRRTGYLRDFTRGANVHEPTWLGLATQLFGGGRHTYNFVWRAGLSHGVRGKAVRKKLIGIH